MTKPSEEACPHEALDERGTRELVKRVRKLRWIGSEDEAKLLERALRDGQPGDCVLAAFVDTD